VRLKIVPAGAVLDSMGGGFTPGMMSWQQGASMGCVYTIALRRFSSSKTGRKEGSPSHALP
jgi:hypothetical protein